MPKPTVRIFAQLDVNPVHLLGQRTLQAKETATRETAELLQEITDAMAGEATFMEITDRLMGDE